MALNYGRRHFERVHCRSARTTCTDPTWAASTSFLNSFLRAGRTRQRNIPDGVVPVSDTGRRLADPGFRTHRRFYRRACHCPEKRRAPQYLPRRQRQPKSPIRRLVELIFSHASAGISKSSPGALTAGRQPPQKAPRASDKLRALGYRPRVSLRDGLAGTIDWYLSRPLTTVRPATSTQEAHACRPQLPETSPAMPDQPIHKP